jgi:hypothetical protein
MTKHLLSARWLAAVLAGLALTATVEARQRHGGGGGGHGFGGGGFGGGGFGGGHMPGGFGGGHMPGMMPNHMPGGFGGGHMPQVMPNHVGGGYSGGGHIPSIPQAHIPSGASSVHVGHPATPPMHSVHLPAHVGIPSGHAASSVPLSPRAVAHPTGENLAKGSGHPSSAKGNGTNNGISFSGKTPNGNGYDYKAVGSPPVTKRPTGSGGGREGGGAPNSVDSNSHTVGNIVKGAIAVGSGAIALGSQPQYRNPSGPTSSFHTWSQPILTASWSGQPLTPAQVTTLQSHISTDNTLTPGQMAIAAAVLQNDRDLKSQQVVLAPLNDSTGDPSTNALIPSSFQVAMLTEAVAVTPLAAGPTSSITEGPAPKPVASTVEVAQTEETNPTPVDDGPVYGMKITELDDEGTAAKEGLLVGDVILAINGQATPNFDEVRSALEKTGDKAEVIFLNKDNGKVERIVLRPVESRIGASVEAVQVR